MSSLYRTLAKNSSILDKEKYQKMVKKIQVNPIVTDALLKELKTVPKDESPLDLIFAIKYKDSSNNRIYTTECYRNIVEQILTSHVIIPVCYGHQSKEEFNYQARTIVGSVIGAYLDEGNELIYYRIIPDASPNNSDIRRWLRNKQLNALSIWGIAESEINSEGVEVINNFLLRSIDLVPPLSEGQENVELIIGEQANLNNANSANNDGTKNNNKEQSMDGMDVKKIDNSILLSEIKQRLLNGNLSIEKAGAELESAGFVSSKLLEEIKLKIGTLEAERNKIFDELKELNITTVDGLIELIRQKKMGDKEKKEKEDFDKNFGEVMNEKGLVKDGKPTGAMHEFVVKWAGCSVGMTKGEMASRIDKVLNDPHFKKSATANVGSPNVDVKTTDNSKLDVEIYTI